MELLSCVEVEPKTTANASIIWLHGLGANGHDFEPIVEELDLPSDLAVRFVFPNAREIPVTINNDMVMPAWYDIYELSLIDNKVDSDGIRQSVAAIKALIKRENRRGIESHRMVLAGFSQGGAIAYECGLTCAKPLAGILGLSTYFATHATCAPTTHNRQTPIAIQHGRVDPVVPEMLGREAARQLTQLGNPVEYKTYQMEHSVCAEQIADISDWLTRVLSR